MYAWPKLARPICGRRPPKPSCQDAENKVISACYAINQPRTNGEHPLWVRDRWPSLAPTPKTANVLCMKPDPLPGASALEGRPRIVWAKTEGPATGRGRLRLWRQLPQFSDSRYNDRGSRRGPF